MSRNKLEKEVNLRKVDINEFPPCCFVCQYYELTPDSGCQCDHVCYFTKQYPRSSVVSRIDINCMNGYSVCDAFERVNNS